MAGSTAQPVIFQHKSAMMNKIDHGTAGTASRAESILILEQSHWHGWPQPLLDKNLLCQSGQYRGDRYWPVVSGVLLKMEVGIRRGAWQTA